MQDCQTTEPSPKSHTLIDDYAMSQARIRARILVTQSGLPEGSEADVQQDMLVELMKAGERFDPDRASKHTFASRVLDRFCQYFVRQQATRKRNGWEDTPCSDLADDFSMDNRPTGNGVTAEFIQDEDRQTIRDVLADLPEDLRLLCDTLSSNPDRTAAAETLGIGRRTVYRRLEKLRKRFAAAGLEIPQRNRGTHRPDPQK